MRNRILAELGEARVENGEMTFGELKDLVPAVRPGKLPNAKKLADEIIKNTYRTLMTRGMKGCYVYCEDMMLQGYLKERIGK